ncbi:MAG: O-antigen ligase family protein, partial [Anaerolineae bacterium]|nr:O-antigen ligase family protein [Anaerolineae bacterium]
NLRPHWSVLFIIFAVAVGATGYLGLQSRQNPAPLAGPLAAAKGYGVTIDLTRFDDQQRTDTLAALRDNGLTWIRQPVEWATLESTAGEIDWQNLDRALAAVDRANAEVTDPLRRFQLIAVLQTTPVWARPDGTSLMTPPTEVSDFGAFAQAVAQRYGRQIDYYQIWHEPNLSANWGSGFVDPAAYANLLREAAITIKAADPDAHILTAALAPTLETGPLNLNEMDYLEQLYQAGADRWFDIVAGQPYGFDSEPGDAAAPDRLNFQRLALLRQVMLDHGDTGTPIWATAFGWNALPAEWSGQPSPWDSDLPAVQAGRTVEAIAYARRNWPWLGPLLAIRWDTVGLSKDDPAQGFALTTRPEIAAVVGQAARDQTIARPGTYPADHPTGHYSPGWRLAGSTADIPRHEPRTLTIAFEGNRLDLHINRGLFRGYLWVTIDGQPAPGLPRDEQGRSYVVLYDPLREADTVTLVENLASGLHEVHIEVEGGWGQWAIAGWSVYDDRDPAPPKFLLVLSATIATLTGLALLGQILQNLTRLSKLAWAWSEIAVSLLAILGERNLIILVFGLAVGFYLAPGVAALLLLPLLAGVILLRPDLGLAVVAFSLSFYQAPKVLPLGSFSPVELALALTTAGFGFRGLVALGRSFYANEADSLPLAAGGWEGVEGPRSTAARPDRGDFSPLNPPAGGTFKKPTLISPGGGIEGGLSALTSQEGEAKSGGEGLDLNQKPKPTLRPLDWAAIALLALALLATLAANNFGVSMREWRVVVFESVLFYFLVRLGLDFGSPGAAVIPRWRWAWRLVDAFMLGAALQALIALYLYFFTDQSITAEGVRRALGLAYGSPNNLSLFLDRAWPILLAVALLPGAPRLRRRVYGAGFVIVSAALYLTFSKGALLVGLPVGLVTMALLYAPPGQSRPRRRAAAVAAGGLLVLLLSLLPLSQTERFRTTFEFGSGSTAFFRLKLWQASLTMLGDHWPLGVGLDNFLYEYRTRYILPDAWQEPNLSHPHNLILDFGTRLGIGGVAILLWFQIVFWGAAWRLYAATGAPLILGLMGSMAIFLSHGLVDNSYFLVDLAFAFFLTVGVVQGLSEDEARRT